MAAQAGFVERLHDEIPAAAVFLAHPVGIGLALLDGLERGFLADDGGAEHGVLVDLHHGLDDLDGAAGVADAEAGHRVGLAEAVQEKWCAPPCPAARRC